MCVLSSYLPLQTCPHFHAPPICNLHSWLPFSPWLERSICRTAYRLHFPTRNQDFFFLLTLTRKKCCSFSPVRCWASSSVHAHPCRALQKHHCPDQSTSWYPPLVTRGNSYWCWVAQTAFDIDKKSLRRNKMKMSPLVCCWGVTLC